MPIRGVTFDFWNTLVAERPESWRIRRDGYVAVVAELGHTATSEQIEASMQAGWHWFEERWKSGVTTSPFDAATRTADDLGLAEHPDAVERLIAVIEQGSDPAAMQIAPDAGDALEALRSEGIACGIISDVGLTPSSRLRQYLDHHGLLEYFGHWSFSDEVGVFKPDGRIFDHAAGGLGVDSSADLAHVGDLRRTDVAGARAMGWTSVRYSGLNDDADDALAEADLVVADHRNLAETLFSHIDR